MALGFLVFFILGWTYYMIARILMSGSIFEGMRAYIDKRAREEWFFDKIKEMLGCLMCTATEAALWTLGLTTFILGMHYGLSSLFLTAIFHKAIVLPLTAEVLLNIMISFALSLGVSGEAWAIKTIVEHQEEKFLALREEFRDREAQLLDKISTLETGTCVTEDYEMDLEVR